MKTKAHYVFYYDVSGNVTKNHLHFSELSLSFPDRFFFSFVCHIAQCNFLFAGLRHEFQTKSVIHDLAENFALVQLKLM